jgi:hypothetical protein
VRQRQNSTQSNPKAEQVANAIALAVLFACPALIAVHSACVSDPDIWWHLRTGEWILNHHMVPRVDPYSASLAGKPWQAYSWLFELLTIKLLQCFGPVGIVGYSASMVLAITVAVWHLIKRLQSDFTIVALLTLATCLSISGLFTPRPWLFSILFFIFEIDILTHARKTGRTRELALLPLIFALWSNLHIQFIDGLLVLGLAFAEPVLTRWGIGEKTRLRASSMAAALAGSFLATLLNPYGWHIYRVAYDLLSQSGVMNKISELQSMPFRDVTNYCVLFLALAAGAALAWHRRLRVFETGLLLFASVISFRSQRDVWVIATVAAAILASQISGRQRVTPRQPRFVTILSVVAAILTVVAGFRVLHVNEKTLETQIAKTMPVSAVETVLANGYAGPLYNDFNWGGYLVWSLRMPVSLDGRAAFYGDRVLDRSLATWNAEPDWASDSQLMSAGLVIGPVKAALIQLLRNDPRFQLVYEDKIAAVFIARKKT